MMHAPVDRADASAGVRKRGPIARWTVPALLIVVALVTRFQQFGNPILHIDEQFYLLVGDRMLRGAVPYVDIWDRKPIGLFLIYAAIRCLGGAGIIQYQLVASAFAVATALVVERIAASLVRSYASVAAGVLYLLWIPLLTGQGGQSPVFYNLFMALAALAVIRAEAARTDRAFVGAGALAMGLVGIALQIKYSAIFEGVFFGVVLLWRGVRAGMRAALLPVMLLWIAVALAPTLAAAAVYLGMGDFQAFWFSNFVSIFQRRDLGRSYALRNAASLALYLAPLVVIAVAGAKARWLRGARSFSASFVTGWLVCAIVAVMVFGYYFDHYGLPIVVPASVSAATIFDDRRRRRWSAVLLAGALLACMVLPTFNQRRRGTPEQFRAVTAIVRPYASRGVLVWDNLPMLYMVLNVPLRTRYPFASHLRDLNETGAIGVDQAREVTRILETRPAIVVIDHDTPPSRPHPTTEMVMNRLARDYHRIASVRVGRHDQYVFLLNGLPVVTISPAILSKPTSLPYRRRDRGARAAGLDPGSVTPRVM